MAVSTVRLAMQSSLPSRARDLGGEDGAGTQIQRSGWGGKRSEGFVCLSSSPSPSPSPSWALCCGALTSTRCSTSATASASGDSSSWGPFLHGGGWRRGGLPGMSGRFDDAGFSLGSWRRRPGREENSRMVVSSSGGGRGGSKNSDDDQVETLFMRELRRRGMSSKEQDGGGSGASPGATGTDTRTRQDAKSSEGSEPRRDDQLKRSMALNSEGLDGLIPRATELVKLGGTFFLNLWPFIVLIMASFLALYLYFGTGFIHTGDRPRIPERYVDPYQLLEQEELPSSIGQNRVPFSNNRPDDTSP